MKPLSILAMSVGLLVACAYATFARGQQILALDAATNTYWAIGGENIGGKATNVVVTLDRESLVTRAAKTLNAVSGVGESFALDLARHRLYIGKMATAEIEMWRIQ